MASLKQIAAELGVTYTLVSKVLSGKMGTTGVSVRTREAILKKAKELDYVPNPLAVALKAGRLGAIGVFLHHMGTDGSEVSDRLLRGLSHGLEKSGFRMWLRFFVTDEEFLAACDSSLKQKVDGLIVAGVNHPALLGHFQKMNREGFPVVSVFSNLPRKLPDGLINTGVDHEAQCLLSTAHLLELGCRNLVHFNTIKSRYDGFVSAHRERRIPFNPALVLDADDFTTATGTLLTRKALKLKVPFDGIVCQSDSQAVGAVNELIRRKIAVPGAVKVTGIDNSPLAEACIVPVTSVTSGMKQSGLEAVSLLLRKIEDKPVKSVLIQPKLVVRESTSQ